MQKPLEKVTYMSDIEISLLAQFIDILEIIEKYESIDEVKKDIKLRKKHIKNEIKYTEKKNEKMGYYTEKEIIEMLKQIQCLANHNELSYVKDYLIIMLDSCKENINKK